MDADGREQISDVQLQDLIAMIRNAEKSRTFPPLSVKFTGVFVLE